MNQTVFTVHSNETIADKVYLLELSGDTSHITKPGQFVNIKLDGFYLRRPISVCAVDNGKLTLIYKVVGRGTEYMSTLSEGAKLDILCGLGNGFDTTLSGERPLLVGGGVGTPPMYQLARELIAKGAKPVVILGFGTQKEVFFESEFKELGCDVYVTTVDGSYGIKGFVTDALDKAGECTHLYTCGPEPMLKALYEKCALDGQFSFEERMGCGFGACVGCTCKTKYGNKRICKDGPVLSKAEIIW